MKLFLVACWLIIVASTGYAIQCYVCSDCSDVTLLEKNQLVNCSSSHSACQKTTTNDSVSRGCSTSAAEVCVTIAAGRFCICNGDRCNSENVFPAELFYTFPTTTSGASHTLQNLYVVSHLVRAACVVVLLLN
ncbi:uncharacterized protein LOC144421095 [Styela clava]